MAATERNVLRPVLRAQRQLFKPCTCGQRRRYASPAHAAALQDQSSNPGDPISDLESSSVISPSTSSDVSSFDPVSRSRSGRQQLPPSRYQFRPPRYYRGPLHPHQPPPVSDPSSRLFEPGPFALPRLQQTFDSTIASDIMTMTYQHQPPGHRTPTKSARLRAWEGNSPYFANRPLRGPRGGDVLRLLRQPINFRNIPKLEGVTVHTMVSEAASDSAYLHVAGMVLQAITNVKATSHKTKKSVAAWKMREGQYLSVSADLKGEDMYHFMSKLVEVVMPKMKDWRGVKGSSGDSSGNIAFGLSGEEVALFPEVEVNYDMYPPKLIPGCNIIIKTTARNDRDARLLLTSIGVPFYGKFVN